MTNCSYIFYDCRKIKQIIFTNFNTNNVTYMNHMFCYCNKLSELSDISKWNTNTVINMCFMFYNCYYLSSLPVFQNGIQIMLVI